MHVLRSVGKNSSDAHAVN